MKKTCIQLEEIKQRARVWCADRWAFGQSGVSVQREWAAYKRRAWEAWACDQNIVKIRKEIENHSSVPLVPRFLSLFISRQ